MHPIELETYLHTFIPLTKAMQVSVLSIEPDSLVLGAPLKPNINPHQTVFGGSVATLATLSAWSLLHSRLVSEGLQATLVIRRSSLEYERPIKTDFTARAYMSSVQQGEEFVEIFKQQGKARIEILSEVACEGQCGVRFKGEFVVLKAH